MLRNRLDNFKGNRKEKKILFLAPLYLSVLNFAIKGLMLDLLFISHYLETYLVNSISS